MQSSSNPTPDTEFIARDDESEAKRYMDTTGVGEPTYLNADDVRMYSLGDLGIHTIDRNDVP